jgi:eukaryotic-like serine/threonine-protein kinase
MPLAAHTRLGPYEIQSAVGAGGMGEVYKARDTRLDRTVAIKVLPSSLATDPDFRERFDREARTISQLDHPHICALYDVGDHNGTAYLVMQYLDGETLADRLSKGALPLEQALQFAIQIGAALDKAHRAGIIHRDLKPGNIMLTKAGATLLDFGLAKTVPATSGALGASVATREQPMTGAGAILGTLQYMAPEQLEGGEADARSDIFAFGAVLYEMLTGTKAFDGKTPASVISSILKDTPRPIAERQPMTPPALDHILRRCLAKDPDERWQTASDATRELKWIVEGGGTTAGSPAAAAGSQRLTRGLAGVVTGVLVGALLTAGIFWSTGRRAHSPASGVTRAFIGVTPADQLLDRLGAPDGRPNRQALALFPDGRSLVFTGVHAGVPQLYVRALDRLDSAPIAGTEGGASPFVSPDGRWIGFWANGELKKVPAGGGPPVTLCRTGVPYGATWGSDDHIVFARAVGGLWQVSAAGGAPEALTKTDAAKGEVSHRLPHALPDGDGILFTVARTRFPKWDETQIAVYSRRTNSVRVLIEGGADARYAPSGHLVYAREGVLMAAPFDLRSMSVTGGPVGVAADVMQAAYAAGSTNDSGAGQFTLSESGALAYLRGGVSPDLEFSLVFVDRSGHAERLAIPPRPFLQPRLSPDGRRLAVAATGRNLDIWIFDVSRGIFTRLTTTGRNGAPVWTPDGTRVVYRSGVVGPDNLVWQAADGTGTPERLMASPHHIVPAFFAPGGKALGFYDMGDDPTNNPADIWTLSIDDRRATPIVQNTFLKSGADLSADGQWLAYTSSESGRNEVYVQPYGHPGARQQVSVSGGQAPAWRRDGKELFYGVTAGSGSHQIDMMSVSITTEPDFRAGTPTRLFQGTYNLGAPPRNYDVTADGQRFLMVEESPKPPAPITQIVLVENWLEELKTRVQTK